MTKLNQINTISTVRVSIIVPLYNTYEYLDECIHSLICQTYSNIEILLIDDGSTDGSDEICDLYKNKDPRISVIHNKNAGLSYSRNYALDICKGEYVTFVDSDDYISLDFVEVLLDALQKNHLSMCFCNNKSFTDSDSPINTTQTADISVHQYTGEECIKDLLSEREFCGVRVTGGLISKDCFNNKRFTVGMLHEDTDITPSLFGDAEKIGYINIPMYFQRLREGSLTRSKLSSKNLDLIKAYENAYQYCLCKYPQYGYLATNRIIGSALTLLIRYYKDNVRIPGFEARCMDSLAGYIHTPRIEMRYRIAYIAVRIAPHMTARMAAYVYHLN